MVSLILGLQRYAFKNKIKKLLKKNSMADKNGGKLASKSKLTR
jgi:hypothetical protein